MSFYTFHDREHRPLGMGSLEKKVIRFFRQNENKDCYEVESQGIALQSASGRFMAQEHINGDKRALVIYLIRKHFRIVKSDVHPFKNKSTINKRSSPTGQLLLTFEAVFQRELTI